MLALHRRFTGTSYSSVARTQVNRAFMSKRGRSISNVLPSTTHLQKFRLGCNRRNSQNRPQDTATWPHAEAEVFQFSPNLPYVPRLLCSTNGWESTFIAASQWRRPRAAPASRVMDGLRTTLARTLAMWRPLQNKSLGIDVIAVPCN